MDEKKSWAIMQEGRIHWPFHTNNRVCVAFHTLPYFLINYTCRYIVSCRAFKEPKAKHRTDRAHIPYQMLLPAHIHGMFMSLGK